MWRFRLSEKISCFSSFFLCVVLFCDLHMRRQLEPLLGDMLSPHSFPHSHSLPPTVLCFCPITRPLSSLNVLGCCCVFPPSCWVSSFLVLWCPLQVGGSLPSWGIHSSGFRRPSALFKVKILKKLAAFFPSQVKVAGMTLNKRWYSGALCCQCKGIIQRGLTPECCQINSYFF